MSDTPTAPEPIPTNVVLKVGKKGKTETPREPTE